MSQNNKNKYGQFFTKNKEILSILVGLISKNKKEEKILEPSCGEGYILRELENQQYKNILGLTIQSPENIIRAKKSKKLPAVLSREETAKIFSLLPENDYGLFLRLLECCSYKVVAVGFHALPTEGVSYLAKIGLIWLLMMCSGVYYERKMEQL